MDESSVTSTVSAADVDAVVRVGELGFVAAGDDDARAFVVGEQRYGAGNAAAPADHHNGFVLQRITHRDCSSEHRCQIGMCNPELHGLHRQVNGRTRN